MGETASMAAELTFQFDAAVLSGLIAGLATLMLLVLMLATMPVRFPLNPLYIVGSAFSIDTTPAYLWGLAALLIGSIAYGCFIGAVQVGFEIESFRYQWGAVTGLVLSIVTGTTLAYSRNLNRAVRAGYVNDPGPFLLRYGVNSAVQIALAHAIFGALAGQLYSSFS